MWLIFLLLAGVLLIYLLSSNETYVTALSRILNGLWVTIYVTAISYFLALVIGLVAGLGRVSKNRVISNIATLYVQVIRGVPILVQLLFWAFVIIPLLIDGLNALGAIVDECIAYKTEAETEDVAGVQAAFRECGADIVTFTSSSTAENFFKLGLPWPEGCRAASIGPVTTATLKELGHAPSITAKTHDINGLVEAIVKAAGK